MVQDAICQWLAETRRVQTFNAPTFRSDDPLDDGRRCVLSLRGRASGTRRRIDAEPMEEIAHVAHAGAFASERSRDGAISGRSDQSQA
jgi:hypothetical protein